MSKKESPVSVEELVALGVSENKAKQSVKSRDVAASSRFFIDEAKARGGDLTSKDFGLMIMDIASKVKMSVREELRMMLLDYLFKPEDVRLSTPEQLKAAIKFVNGAGDKAVTEEEFATASGSGVVVSAEDITTKINEVIEAERANIDEMGWGYEVKVMQQVLKALPFAPGSEVRKQIGEALTPILGDKANAKKQKKKRNKTKGKASNKQQQQEEAKDLDTQTPNDSTTTPATTSAETTTATEEKKESSAKQVVTPWEATAEKEFDYNYLIEQFGSEPISDDHLARMKKLGLKVHHFLERGIFFSHRDLDVVLDMKEKGEPIYLYTGRGPSSSAMHLGHLIPFMFTKYLQEVFDIPLVIQMTDDEKFLFKKNLTLDDDEKTGVERMCRENVKDIIALGFDPEKTFIFSDLKYMGGEFYKNVVKFQRHVNLNKARHIFGFTEENNIGEIAFCAIQAVPSFPSSFEGVIDPKAHCLIPCAIDQDPYFRLTRDIAPKLREKKPALMHSVFFPAMTGGTTKMSSSTQSETTVFLTDSPEQIKKKVMKHAFSGAPNTLKEFLEQGADTEVDISYQYLRFFMEDSDRLEEIRRLYTAGDKSMTTGVVKGELIKVLQQIVKTHQDARESVTDEDVDKFMTPRKMF
eukprot:m.83129 g.83129  ORF g.83129 m.83129 type:complete len:638 (+) comp12111_c0_seq1:65-1978(+)